MPIESVLTSRRDYQVNWAFMLMLIEQVVQTDPSDITADSFNTILHELIHQAYSFRESNTLSSKFVYYCV